MENEFYTYAYLRKNGKPYYIGKGKGRRCYEGYGRCARTPKDKSRILILKKNLSEEDAYKHEIYLIAILGKKCDGGLLYNVQDGGSAPPRMQGKEHPNYGGVFGPKCAEKISNTLSSCWELTFKNGEIIQVKNLAKWCRENPDYRFQNVYALADENTRLQTYKELKQVRKIKQGKSPAQKQKKQQQ